MINWLIRLNHRYDGMQEPWRFLIGSLLIMPPVLIAICWHSEPSVLAPLVALGWVFMVAVFRWLPNLAER